MDDEKVSILLPVPAGEGDDDPCQATLHSIASQSYPSTLIEICQVQYVEDAPEGRTSALNAARDNASGAYLVHTSPGTTWDPTKIERQVLRLEEDGTRHATAHEMRAAPIGTAYHGLYAAPQTRSSRGEPDSTPLGIRKPDAPRGQSRKPGRLSVCGGGFLGTRGSPRLEGYGGGSGFRVWEGSEPP